MIEMDNHPKWETMTEREKFLHQLVVLDTETTSLNFKEAQVIEFGYVIKDDGVWKTHGSLHKPTISITPEVSAITNITDKMVASCNSFSSVYKDFDSMLHRRKQYVHKLAMVAHNAFYDRKVFEHGYSESDSLNYEWLCTMRMAKKLFADEPTVTQFNLPYLRYRFELDIPENMPHHRASTDAYMTAKLMVFLVDAMEMMNVIDTELPYYEQIVEWMAKPVIMTKMPMGKHKGKALTEVPLDYWMWALDNFDNLQESKDEYDADFAASVAKAIDSMI